MRVTPLFAVFLTIMFDTLSFSVAIPDLQTRVFDLVPHGLVAWQSGLISGGVIALYSIVQFFVAPWLGAMSDRVGRRKVLVVTSWLSVLSAFLYIFATNLPIIAVSRMLFGAAAANVGVAQAYISDNSTEADRAKAMGVLGMAFGTGFIFGPPIGALLLKLAHGSPAGIGIFSTVFGLVNVFFVTFFLPEAPRQATETRPKRNRLDLLTSAMRPPALRMLLLAFLAYQLGFSNLESTYFLLGRDVYKVEPGLVASVLILVGVVQFGTQGGLVRILIPRLGERRMMNYGYITTVPSMCAIPFVPWGPLVYVGALMLGLGSGTAQPAVNSLISREAPPEIVGEVFGVAASLSAFARIVIPSVANVLYPYWRQYPYLLATVLIAIAVVFTLLYRPSAAAQASSVVAES